MIRGFVFIGCLVTPRVRDDREVAVAIIGHLRGRVGAARKPLFFFGEQSLARRRVNGGRAVVVKIFFRNLRGEIRRVNRGLLQSVYDVRAASRARGRHAVNIFVHGFALIARHVHVTLLGA